MTEERFEELVNLYLDNEIGRHDLAELKHAIKDNLVWRRRFERACQLHQAASKALSERSAGAEHRHSSARAHGGGHHEHREHSTRVHHSSGAATARVQSADEKQARLHRNATIGTLAERQESTGAAATISMGSSRKSRSSSSTGGNSTIPFFTSTLAMALGGVFATVILCGIIYAFTREDSEFGGLQADDLSALLETPRNRAELDALLPAIAQTEEGVDAADALRARFYTSALAANSVTRTLQLNYYSTGPAAPMGDAPATAEAWRLQVTENTYLSPAPFDVGQASPAPAVMNPPAPVANTTSTEPTTPNMLMP